MTEGTKMTFAEMQAVFDVVIETGQPQRFPEPIHLTDDGHADGYNRILISVEDSHVVISRLEP